MFIEAFFIFIKNRKQSRHPSSGERMNKPCYFNTIEHYSAIIRNGLLNHAETWMNLIYTLPSERSQSEKVTFYTYPFV